MEADTRGPELQLGAETRALLPHSAEGRGPGRRWWGADGVAPAVPVWASALPAVLLPAASRSVDSGAGSGAGGDPPSVGRPACLPARRRLASSGRPGARVFSGSPLCTWGPRFSSGARAVAAGVLSPASHGLGEGRALFAVSAGAHRGLCGLGF